MALAPGTRLGVYEITAQIGEGGMGAVYRATDTNLGRQVAIKVLPDAFAQDAERIARFAREAKTLAALNHPNIAAIYGFEKSAGVHALVMELVEGDDLSQRIQGHGKTESGLKAEGSGLALDEALPIAKQIATALEAAHAQNIIHRDLKPANIKIRRDGVVKVLDFGLAKALDDGAGEAGRAGRAGGANFSQSPTITTPAMTQAGMILGTAAYMSPEQAKGRTVDRRADIWAFGCVLYEMLTGVRAFPGDGVSDTLAAVLRADPDWTRLPIDTPKAVRTLLTECLQKDPSQRPTDVAVATYVLRHLDAVHHSPSSSAERSRRGRFGAALGGVGVVIAASMALYVFRPQASVARGDARPYHLSLVAAPGQPFPTAGGGGVFRGTAIAPDGRFIVYTSRGGLVVQYLDRASANQPSTKVLSGPKGPQSPFVSPDGRWVGYMSDRAELQKISVDGGSPVTICHVDSSLRGATWADDDTIYYATADQKSGLWRVSANGGEPAVVTRPENPHEDHILPSAMPDGRVLFTVLSGNSDRTSVAVFDPVSKQTRVLVSSGSSPVFAMGYIAYVSGGSLRASRFDAATTTVAADSSILAEAVETLSFGTANFALSRGGALVFQSRPADAKRRLAWVDRRDHEEATAFREQGYRSLRLSLDGGRVVTDVRNQSFEGSLWVGDMARETIAPLRDEIAVMQRPVWMPDGRHIIFSGNYDGQFNLLSRFVDGTEMAKPLMPSVNRQLPSSVSRDGRWLLYAEFASGAANDDLRALSIVDREVKPLLGSASTENSGEISPDGHYLAYQSNESNQSEVYVRPFPKIDDGWWQISRHGGGLPTWSPNGRELFYLDATNSIVAQSFVPGTPPKLGPPTRLVTNVFNAGSSVRTYDVNPDGTRFLVIKEVDGSALAPSTLSVVVNALSPAALKSH